MAPGFTSDIMSDLFLAEMKPKNNSADMMSKNASDKDLKKAESGEVNDGHSSSSRVRGAGVVVFYLQKNRCNELNT